LMSVCREYQRSSKSSRTLIATYLTHGLFDGPGKYDIWD
jgi:hypothetical protein